MKVPQEILKIAYEQLQSAKSDVSYYENQIDIWKKNIENDEKSLKDRKRIVEEYQLFLDSVDFKPPKPEKNIKINFGSTERMRELAGIKEND